MKNIKLFLVLFLSVILLMIGACTGNLIKSMGNVNEWIEQKPFPVKIEFNKMEEISDVKLYYSINGSESIEIPLQRQGKEYQFTIPGVEMVPGYLQYYVTFLYKDKLETSDTVSVKILTIEEARTKLENELYQRVTHSKPGDVPVNLDLILELSIKDAKPSTQVTFYYKPENSSTYEDQRLSNDGNGKFVAKISDDELEDGYNSYYYDIKEENEDVGELHIQYPRNGEVNPLKFHILTLEELRELMRKELSESVKHDPPQEAFEIFSLEIIMNIEYKDGTYLKKFGKNDPEVDIYIGKNGSSYKKQTMDEYKDNWFKYEIPKEAIKDGYNTYYFEISDDAQDVGNIKAEYKSRSNPFKYDIVGIEELAYVMEKEMQKSFSHRPPKDAIATEDLDISVKINYPEGSFIKKLSKDKIQVDIYYGIDGGSYKRAGMSDRQNTFMYTISKQEIQKGYDSYYFIIKDEADQVGNVEAEYPENGVDNPFQYKIKSLDEIKKERAKELYRRITHNKPADTYALEDLDITLNIKDAQKDTKAVLKIKKPDQNDYKSIRMSKEDDRFTGMVSVTDLQRGYSQYYFEIILQYSDIGELTIDYPSGGESNPLRITILDSSDMRRQYEDDLLSRIRHKPVTSATQGVELELALIVENMKNDTKVYLNHKNSSDRSYKRVEANRYRNKFTAEISKDDIRKGHNQYYFEITEPNEYFGTITVFEPVKGEADPYEFDIVGLEDLIYDGIEFVQLDDVELGEDVPVSIIINNIPENIKVKIFFHYRVEGDDRYKQLPMKEEDNNTFTLTLGSNKLKEEGRVDYFFEIRVDSENISINYPGGNIQSYYFNVNKKETGGGNEGGEDNVFGNSEQTEENMLEGRIYQLEKNTKELPERLHRDYESLGTLYTRTINIAPRDFTEGFPGLKNVYEWFAIQYRGMIYIKESGTYKFRLLSDDGSKLYIDSELIIDNDGLHSPKSKEESVYFSKGEYPIRIDYFQGPKTKIALQLFATQPNEQEKIFDLADFEK